MISKELRKIYAPFYIRFLIYWVHLTFRYKKWFATKNHSLDNELIVTLTSYPARFNTLDLTLKCMLNQSVKPDKVILWIAYEDKKLLPEKVLVLEKEGLEIRFTEDIRSYKKIIPALREFPEASFIIVDDDLYYKRNLIKLFLNKSMSFPLAVIAGRVHEVKFNSSGQIDNYKGWGWDSLNSKCDNLFFTGCGGVYFPAKVFPAETENQKTFIKLAPMADDIWLNWMLKLNSVPVVGVGKRFQFWDWPESQKNTLHSANVSSLGNDEQIQNMIKKYGQLYQKEGLIVQIKR